MTYNLQRSAQSGVIHGDIGDGAPVYGNPEVFFGQALIGFVDLLGFSTSVRLNWSDKADSPLDKLFRIKEKAEKSREKVFGYYTETKTVPSKPKVTKAYKSRIHTVSDSIVICGACDAKMSIADFYPQLLSVLASASEVWEGALDEGFTIRGAIEFGPIYWTDAETIGPAFLDAYAIESKMARWSRVLIGPSLLQLIARLPSELFGQVAPFLHVSSDHLIELSPALRLGAHLEQIEAMNGAAEHSRDKYEPLLDILRGNASTPTVDDLKRAVAIMRDESQRT